jgi:hypothetical protein
VNTYYLPYSESGLVLVIELTLSLRAAGFKTAVSETSLCGFPVYQLTATPAVRLSRKARGL